MSDGLDLIPQLLDYFLTRISLERSMWEGPKTNYMTLGPKFYLFIVFDDFCDYSYIFVALSIIKTLRTHYNWAFQALGVWKNDFSWSKLAWSIYQSLFWFENDHDNCPQANSGRTFDFFKIALNRVLTLPKARSRKMRQFPLKKLGLQNKNISVVTKHWKYRNSVPMSYILGLGTSWLWYSILMKRRNKNKV